MNMQAKLKFLVLSIALATAMMLPMNSNAQGQNDDFFKKDDWATQRSFITIGGGGLIPQGIGEPAPLGSGLLVLSLAGAGYAVTRRRRSIRKGMAVLLAFAMMIGFTQCKKNLDVLPGSDAGKVHITLRVDNGSRVVVDTLHAATNGFAAVSFESGDIMYVGYNKAYVGYLTYDGTDFNGDINITQTVTDEPLYFYFLGGKGFTPTIEGNVATLDISDQTSKYPVINFAHSAEVYPSSTGNYSARLLNKCAIVKLHVKKPTGYDQAGTCITGMNNLLTVNFDHTTANTDEGFTYSQVNGGEITIPSNVGDVWAILLPQEQNSNVYAFSTHCATQNPVTIPQIAANDYNPNGINLNLTHTFISVSATQKVCFAPGNLQYLGNANGTGTWRFAEHQYDFMGDGPSSGTNYQGNVTVSGYTKYNASADLDVARDLFGWGTSGYNNKYPYMTSTNSDSYYRESMVGDGSNYDWGVYHSSSGGSTEKITNGDDWSWRLWTSIEMSYVFARKGYVWTRSDYQQTKELYAPATVLGVKGIIIFPDNWTGAFYKYIKYGTPSGSSYTSNVFDDADQWALFEKLGCVFLPAAHIRGGAAMSYLNEGHYWTSTSIAYSNEMRGGALEFTNSILLSSTSNKCLRRFGQSVRLIRNVD